jgi:hypothetical protein
VTSHPSRLIILLAGLALTMPLLAARATAQPAQATEPASADAQASEPQRSIETRAQQIAKEQAAKAPLVKPYEPTRGERAVMAAEASLLNPPPLYVWFGSIYPGGLLAVGAGARRPIGDTALVDVHGGWSLRNYKGAQALFRLPELADRRVRIELRAQGFDAPAVAYYGLGRNSQKGDKATFSYQPITLGGIVTVKPEPHVAIGGGADYLHISTGPGDRNTSINDRFTPETAPGLGADPEYLRTQIFAGYDWRASPGYTDRGGWYHAEWYDYRRRDAGIGDFSRLDAEVRQFFPILRANQVIALRGLISTTSIDRDDQVPYFLMPDLGGADELRGYPAFRFRDRHRILTSAEYRWKAGQFVDLALFADAGKVEADRSDLNLKGLIKTYGIGVRFHAPSATVLRVELARTRDGMALVFAAGQIF